jgi:hypothetical protein
MGNPTRTDPRVVDATTSVDATVVATAPAVAMAGLYQTLANAQAMAAFNAVHAQQQAFIAHQAATTAAVAMLLALIED